MTSFKKSILLACAASVMTFGVALAQTDTTAPAAGGTTAAPTAGDAGAAGADAGAMAKPAKKHMSKKKHSKKKKGSM